MFSEGLKVTNNFDLPLLTAAGALFVGKVCAKQILPPSVSAVKLCQFLSFNNSELIHSLNPGISEVEYFTAALIFLCDKPEVNGYVVS